MVNSRARNRMRYYTIRELLDISLTLDENYWLWAVCAGFLRVEVARGGIGAAIPAVVEPRPNFCKVGASSFPEGLRPWAD